MLGETLAVAIDLNLATARATNISSKVIGPVRPMLSENLS